MFARAARARPRKANAGAPFSAAPHRAQRFMRRKCKTPRCHDCAQVKVRGVNLSPTQEEKSMQHSARLSGSQELGRERSSLMQVPVPSAISSKTANRELFIRKVLFFGKISLFYTLCAAPCRRERLII